MYPGLRDRIYFSAQAILWIHICSVYVSEEFALRFPLPIIQSGDMYLDDDLRCLLNIFIGRPASNIIAWIYGINPPHYTPAYSQWLLDSLLHLSLAEQSEHGAFDDVGCFNGMYDESLIPVNTLLNYLLVSCIILGQHIVKEVLKIQDKLYGGPFYLCPDGSLYHSLAITWSRS